MIFRKRNQFNIVNYLLSVQGKKNVYAEFYSKQISYARRYIVFCILFLVPILCEFATHSKATYNKLMKFDIAKGVVAYIGRTRRILIVNSPLDTEVRFLLMLDNSISFI